LFSISHINKQTTYQNPLAMQQLVQNKSTLTNFTSKSDIDHNLINQSNSNSVGNNTALPNSNSNQLRSNVFFTRNPQELKGEFIKTILQKTPYGFGFTIIGANETSEDFLQIKFIVPDGAAARDGHLKQGDVLVYVNNECVLGYTHQDVVEIFQSIPAGNNVELTVCRGYPLSIDPNDPNIEIMSLPAINNPNKKQNFQQAPLASVDELSLSHKQAEPDEYFCEEYDVLYASIVKGPKGFGFTIADDSQINHQKVKQILDKERCCNLVENDILLQINGQDLKNLTHNQVVELLKDCGKGEETIIKLKRRKYQIVMNQTPNDADVNKPENLNKQGWC
jgi:atrophin-1 interacting protein 3 (BAI1-associated protein 1)